jgi:hypothetical protein
LKNRAIWQARNIYTALLPARADGRAASGENSKSLRGQALPRHDRFADTLLEHIHN